MIEGGNLKRPNFIISIVALILVLSVGGCSSGLSDAKLAYNYGINSSKQGLYAEAIQNFDKAIQLDAEYAKATTTGVILTPIWANTNGPSRTLTKPYS